jgi:hypothetical protein
MKIAVIGSRSFGNQILLEKELESIKNQIDVIISGGAMGADQLAEKWAINKNIPTLIIKPNWSEFGRSAGIVRNKQIIESCDMCIAFWDGISKGTFSSINLCEKMGKNIKIIKF